jgi:predicted phosphodiesterase
VDIGDPTNGGADISSTSFTTGGRISGTLTVQGDTMTQKLIIIGDTHGNYEVIEKIFQKENALGEVVAILHAGDIGVYDENSIGVLDEATGKYSGRMSQKEIKNILRHNDPIGEFLPYLKGEKKFPVPVYNIAGNHEDFDLYDDLLEGRIKVENFILLQFR